MVVKPACVPISDGRDVGSCPSTALPEDPLIAMVKYLVELDRWCRDEGHSFDSSIGWAPPLNFVRPANGGLIVGK